MFFGSFSFFVGNFCLVVDWWLVGSGFDIVEGFVGKGDSVGIDDGLLFEFGLDEVELLVEFIDAEDDSEDDESPFEQSESGSEESVDPSKLDGFEQFGQESSCDIKRNGNTQEE